MITEQGKPIGNVTPDGFQHPPNTPQSVKQLPSGIVHSELKLDEKQDGNFR